MPRPKMNNLQKSTFMIPAELHKALTYIARRRGSTYSQLLRDISREYVVKALHEERALVQARQDQEPQENQNLQHEPASSSAAHPTSVAESAPAGESQ